MEALRRGQQPQPRPMQDSVERGVELIYTAPDDSSIAQQNRLLLKIMTTYRISPEMANPSGQHTFGSHGALYAVVQGPYHHVFRKYTYCKTTGEPYSSRCHIEHAVILDLTSVEPGTTTSSKHEVMLELFQPFVDHEHFLRVLEQKVKEKSNNEPARLKVAWNIFEITRDKLGCWILTFKERVRVGYATVTLEHSNDRELLVQHPDGNWKVFALYLYIPFAKVLRKKGALLGHGYYVVEHEQLHHIFQSTRHYLKQVFGPQEKNAKLDGTWRFPRPCANYICTIDTKFAPDNSQAVVAALFDDLWDYFKTIKEVKVSNPPEYVTGLGAFFLAFDRQCASPLPLETRHNVFDIDSESIPGRSGHTVRILTWLGRQHENEPNM